MPALAPVVVMGVSGSGKSTVGALLATALGVPFVDGDDLHPAANIAKMSAGIPLTDADRAPWLDAVGARLAEGPVVIACSALKRSYRDRLRAAAPGLRLVYLRVGAAALGDRMRHRHHFMPPALLESQLTTLEEPAADERPLIVDGDALPPSGIVALLVPALSAPPSRSERIGSAAGWEG